MIRRFGAIGDVHAEHRLLGAALTHLDSARIDAVLCVGDIVDGRGDVDACCTLLERASALAVRGNHGRWLLSEQMRGLPMAHRARDLEPRSLAYLAALPVTRRLETIAGPLLLCHGLGDDDMARLRPYDEGYALECIDALAALRVSDLAMVVGGHTHERMVRTFGALTFVNAGTLARDGSPCFVVVDFETRFVQFYDLDGDACIHEAERLALP